MITIFDIESDELKIRQLKQLLSGNVLAWYANFWNNRLAENDRESIPFHEVEAAFTQRYGTNDDPLAIWCRIGDMCHAGDVTKYNELFGRAMTSARSKFTSIEHLITLEYIRGLEPDYAEAVSQKNPSSWLEAAQFAELHACPQSRPRVRERKRSLAARQHSLEKVYTKRCKANEQEHGMGAAEQHNRLAMPRNNRCYNCQRVGHWAKDCRKTKKHRPETRGLVPKFAPWAMHYGSVT
ncbi:hypothetical protein BZL39_A02550 [Zygosaccharomyces parabailii]|nr:hypothetical protein BZL39_A02550 [Zygosaccharomyces parabailii]CDH12965.1 uncharacterized protein ZBAI_04751 [Zygosaccharomyces bailii ISA1307]